MWTAATTYHQGKKRFTTFAYKGIERRIRQVIHKYNARSTISIPPSDKKETAELKEYKKEMKSHPVYSLDYVPKNSEYTSHEIESDYSIPCQPKEIIVPTKAEKIANGVIVVRMTPEQHRRAKFAATLFPEVSLNIFCRDAILAATDKKLQGIEEPAY